MAGHSQFKNIMHRKGRQDAKRAQQFTKILREIITAARLGMPDIQHNPTLRAVVLKARSLNIPKDRIDYAIAKGANPAVGEHYEAVRYEGYMPGGVAVIVEALTDNRNRTASDVRSIFTKHGGALGETGSVAFQFDRLGCITLAAERVTEEALLETALEIGAEDVLLEEGLHHIYTAPDQLHQIVESLAVRYGEPSGVMLVWRPQLYVTISDAEAAGKLEKFMDALEELDDVQHVFVNASFSDATS